MKKILLIGAATLMVSNPTFAGGILTNTNQHASFLRMIARGASIDIDGVYSNPAGLSFLPEDGFYLSLTGQSAYQTREITSTFPLFQAPGVRDADICRKIIFRRVICAFPQARRRCGRGSGGTGRDCVGTAPKRARP